jgi:hypothetical protein
MDRAIEKTLSARAVELGRAGEPAGLPVLVDLLGKPSGEVRRLAVSAIGKLAGLADARVAVPALQARLLDPHPQVRQYAIKALSAYGTAASSALPDLEDISRNPIEKEYNRNDSVKAIGIIREAMRIAIQYWGMDTADYKIGMLKKQKLYQETGKKLVSVYFQEFDRIEAVLAQKLASFRGGG